MAITIKYTKSQYLAKITELEGYYNQLAVHEQRMVDLKDKMYDFWEGEGAQKTGALLDSKLRLVRNAMDTTSETLNQYKVAVEKLESRDISASDLLEPLLGLLEDF